MTLVLLALVVAILALSVINARRGHERSVRRSMNRYLETVLADLGALSLKPYKEQT